MNSACFVFASTLPSAAQRTCAAPLRQLFYSYRFSNAFKRSFTACQKQQWSVTQAYQARQRTTTRRDQTAVARETFKSSTPKTVEEQDDAELWRNYDPEGGLPLPQGELKERQIREIFGSDTKLATGNYILSVLHWRRMSGALIDNGIDFSKESKVTREQALKGLDYLRNTYPEVDEETLSSRWVEEETQRVRSELQDRAVRLRLYKPSTIEEQEMLQDEVEEDQETSQQGTAYGRARSGTSAVEGLRGAFKARREAYEAKRSVELAHKERSLLHKARGPLELLGGLQPTANVKRYGTYDVVLRDPEINAAVPAEPPKWVKAYEEKARVSEWEKPPDMSTAQRLVPSFTLMALAVALCIAYSNYYTPPSTEDRLFPSIPPSVATLGGITALLCTSFVVLKIPQLWKISNKYFCIVPAYPFPASMLGAIFRHDHLSHLAINVITLWVFGLNLHENIGRGNFLAIFIGAGAMTSFATLTNSVLTRTFSNYIYGASGAVLGLLGAQCTIKPMATISIFGYDLRIALWALFVLYAAGEIVSLFRFRTATVDHAGHLAGLFSGSAAGFYMRQRLYGKDSIKRAAEREEAMMKPENAQ